MIRRAKLFVLVLAVIVGVQIVLSSATVSAASKSGACYFHTNKTCQGSSTISAGWALCGTNDVFSGNREGKVRNGSYYCTGESDIADKTNKADFVSFIKSKFNNGPNDSDRNRVGAHLVVAVMLGQGHTWPKSDDLDSWVAAMSASNISVKKSTYNPSTTSYWDPAKGDDFFAPTSAPTSDVIMIYDNVTKSVYAYIETACGNLVAGPTKLPKPSSWGPMKASSAATVTRGGVPVASGVKRGDVIKWTHKVWDSGGTLKTPTITGDVKWGPEGSKGGTVAPSPAYSQTFSSGTDKGITKTNTFTIPGSAAPGSKYCQHINGDHTSSSDSSSFWSTSACVILGSTPPVGAEVDSATCSMSLNNHGPVEVSSQSFSANYSATVYSNGVPKDGRPGPTPWGSWSGWSGWSGSDTYRTSYRTRTATTDNTYYRVVKASFTSNFDGNNSPNSRTSPQSTGIVGNGSPYSTYYSSPYAAEDAAAEYSVNGDFTYTVEKVVEHYHATHTETRYAQRTKNSKGVYSAWSFSPVYTNYSGWQRNGADTVTVVGGGSVDCGSDSITYAFRPYMAVYGGDIMAGAYQANVNSPGCTQVSSAGIVGWNHNRNESYKGIVRNDYAGAGAEAGAFALAHINSFSSALNGTSAANRPPAGLSFANTTGVAGNQHGGSFGSLPLSCNFASDLAAATNLPSPSNYSNGAYTGQHTYKASGNVYISGNVVYSNSGSWVKPKDIPRFKLLVTGNIYISGNNVSELDGLYMATGNIYTCATGPGSPSTDYGTCNNQLKVMGAFAARKIIFSRTNGTLYDARPSDQADSGNIGETFIYTPELWLPNEPNGGGLKYDAILGLPPVL